VNALQFDLLGDNLPLANSPVTPAEAQRKVAPKKVVINRKALWTTSKYGNLPGVVEVDRDDEIFNVTSTTNTFSDNTTIERLEVALGLAPVIKNGRWVKDTDGTFMYRLKGQPFKGTREMGKRGSILQQCNILLILESARAAIEALYNNPDSWICLNAVNVLSCRLRRMTEDEDPFACLAAFMQVMQQQDFIDNSRKGETIRNLTKRDLLRERRAGLKAGKDQQSSSTSVSDTNDEEDEFDSLEGDDEDDADLD
jgi:hypothetical protein